MPVVLSDIRVAKTLTSKVGCGHGSSCMITGEDLLLLELLCVDIRLGRGSGKKADGILGVRLLHGCKGQSSTIGTRESHLLRGILDKAVGSGIGSGDQRCIGVGIGLVDIFFALVLRGGVAASVIVLETWLNSSS